MRSSLTTSSAILPGKPSSKGQPSIWGRHAVYDYLPVLAGGCAAMLRIDLGTTLATGISQWNDQSGSGNNVTQAAGSKQPSLTARAYGGWSCARFSAAASQALSRAATNLFGSGAYSIYATVKIAAAMSNTIIGGCGTAGGGAYLFLNGVFMSVLHPGVSNHDTNPVNYDSAAVHVWCARRAAAAAPTLEIDGVSQALGSSGVTGMTDAGAGAALELANGLPAAAAFTSMDLVEFLAFTKQVDDFLSRRLTHYMGASRTIFV